MPVGVEGGRDARVAKLVLNVLRILALSDQHRSVEMSQVMKPLDTALGGLLDQRQSNPLGEVLGINVRTATRSWMVMPSLARRSLIC